MSRWHPVIVSLALILASVVSSIGSYSDTSRWVDEEIQQALAQTLREQPADIITTDTIRTFNSHLQTEALRAQVLLSLRPAGTSQHSAAVPDDEDLATTIEAHCSTATILRLSDQRPAMALASMAFIWAVGIGVLKRRPAPSGITFGGLTLRDHRFFTTNGTEVKFTPMQHQLMEMFFLAPEHRLTKQAICEALWPKKEDASETLYTLILRMKPLLEAQSSLHILSDRSRAYTLTYARED